MPYALTLLCTHIYYEYFPRPPPPTSYALCPRGSALIPTSSLPPPAPHSLQVFRYFEERTPGSRVERRDRTIRWAYGAADPQLGAQQASNLVEHLEKLLGDAPVERSWEGTTVEVRPHGASIGHGLMQLLASDFSKAESAASAYAAASAAAAAQGGKAEADMLAAAAAAAATGSFDPRGFDFVLGLGNFSARDEDVFLKLHEAEVRPDEGPVDERAKHDAEEEQAAFEAAVGQAEYEVRVRGGMREGEPPCVEGMGHGSF